MIINNELNTKLINIAKNQAIMSQNAKFDKILQDLSSDNSKLTSAVSNASNMANSDSKLFATFDFMQAMNQLLYGNPSESERTKLMAKMQEIAKSV
ncbi:hypothetical protein [Campylobacter vicugnae]|uniref:hypothetical protein n=1 Tax=Campylobacter vicugnae TaxID=1660076 RepID=UPI00254BB87E|nr:hypothetical protein [Campylobacter ovis]MDL0105685.1 hypothetical protein [Campylobacter ovis]MDL0107295.1 hypothetical protein [Campylobacter ovis]